ncbi:MAG: hypothetical protein IPH28_08085 [Cytophagaceae bacterium]|nr:hypothetical protein [Cytophagaceae bacterium]
MNRLSFLSLVICLILAACRNKDPQKIEKVISLEFDSIFAPEQNSILIHLNIGDSH